VETCSDTPAADRKAELASDRAAVSAYLDSLDGRCQQNDADGLLP
jgi:hypothetical protein